MGEHMILDIVSSSSQLTERREESTRRRLRIPERLYTENRRTYVPQVLSLGPLHSGSKLELDEYETLKAELLDDILSSTTRQIKEQVEGMILDQQFITAIRQWYALPDCARRGDEDKQLGWMMARDGFCLLEALREISPDYRTSRIPKNPKRIFQRLSFGFAVEEDIMKLENQIPFFVLQRILQWEIKIFQEEISTDEDLILPSNLRQAQHTLFPFFPNMRDWQNWHKLAGVSLRGDSHLLEFVYENIIRSSHSTDRTKCNNNRKAITLPTAVQLKRKGVKFAANAKYLKEIQFDDNGTFRLPATQVHKGVVAVMQNLLAFESLSRKDQTKPLKSYVHLMRSLIKTAADIKVLKDGGIIIEDDSDTDEEVANVWNRMWKRGEESEYEPIDTAVDKATTFYGNHKDRMSFADTLECSLPWVWKKIKAAVSITVVLALLQTIFGWEQFRLQLEGLKKG